MTTKTQSISIKETYSSYYGDVRLIDGFISALRSMGCTLYAQDSYQYDGKSVAFRSISYDCPEDYELERLDVSKEFVKTHREELFKLILRDLVSQVLWIDKEYFPDGWQRFSGKNRGSFVRRWSREIEKLFKQLD